MGEGRHDASTVAGANAPTRRPPPAPHDADPTATGTRLGTGG